MIDTNALMAATFAIISQFHGVVTVPADGIPLGQRDVQRLVVGSPFTPLEVFVQFRNGASYHVRDGAVYRYETANSYFNIQNPSLLPKLMGKPSLSSNEVFTLASKVVAGLQKNGRPVTTGPPRFGAAGNCDGEPIPYYGVTWPATNAGHGHAALVEVDARSGDVTFLHLTDRCFKDLSLAQQISNRVYKPEPEEIMRKPTKRNPVLPLPPTNGVMQAIEAWLSVCEKFRMDPGTQTNLVDVDWDRSCIFTNRALSQIKPMYRICFTNGVELNAFDGAIYYAALADKYYGSRNNERSEIRSKFVGKVEKRWQELAKNFENILIREFGFTAELLSDFTALTYVGDSLAPLGTETLARVVVIWIPLITPAEAKTFRTPGVPPISVEFDICTGEIKGFSFFGPPLAEIFARAQRAL